MTNQTQLKDNVLAILKDKYPCSILELAELLGHKNSRRFIQCLREINGLEELLKKNVVIKELESPNKPSTTPRKMPKKSAVRRSEGNCYRSGSNYSLCYETLYEMGRNKPVSRKALVERICRVSGLDKKRVGFNLNIILSPSIDGSFHRSAKNANYYVEKLENGMVSLALKGKGETCPLINQNQL